MSTQVSVPRDEISFYENKEQLTLVDFTEDDYTREFGLGIVGHRWVPGEHTLETSAIERCQFRGLLHTHATAILGGHVFVRFFDQHFDDRQWWMLFRQSAANAKDKAL
jgi:hypothetical protein